MTLRHISRYHRIRAVTFEAIAIYAAAWDLPPSLHHFLGPRKALHFRFFYQRNFDSLNENKVLDICIIIA